MRRLPANVSGDLVRVALMEARPTGLTTRQLVTATEEDAIAEWHERAAAPDFNVGDRVTIQPAGSVGTIVIGPLGAVGGDTTSRQWIVKIDGDPLPTVCGDDDMTLAT